MRWRKVRFWIFDLDGTLTLPVHDFDWIRAELGLRPAAPILEQLAERPEEERRELLARLDDIEWELARRARPQAGAPELLERLSRNDARLGILTRNSHSIALATLSRCGLASRFDPRFVLGRESCEPKPSADGIRKLLSAWSASAEEAVMVGDSRLDLRAGREAGTATIHFDSRDEPAEPEPADLRVRHLDEIRRLLEIPEG